MDSRTLEYFSERGVINMWLLKTLYITEHLVLDAAEISKETKFYQQELCARRDIGIKSHEAFLCLQNF